MSTYRPYYDPVTFRSPSAASEETGLAEYAFLDVGGGSVSSQTRVSAVGAAVGRFYTRMVVAQPFDTTKFLLQVGEWGNTPYMELNASSEDESEEEVDYFVDTSAAKPLKRTPHRVKTPKTGLQLVRQTEDPFINAVAPTTPGIFDMMSAVADGDGVMSLWRGLHASCLYRAARGLLEAWITGFLASVSATADPQFVDPLQLSDPTLSVSISTAACALAVAILAPVAMIRARLIATSYRSREPRSLRWHLFHLRSPVAPLSVIVPSVLAATAERFVQMCTPMWLAARFEIDQFRSPRMWSLSNLIASIGVLALKMPLETMSNRAQIKAASPARYSLIVRPKYYTGMVQTIWDIVRGRDSLATLYRGWRTEVMGVIGEWGYEILDSGRPNPEHF